MQDTFHRALNIIKAIGTDDQLENVVLKLGNGKFFEMVSENKNTVIDALVQKKAKMLLSLKLIEKIMSSIGCSFRTDKGYFQSS